MIKAKFATQVAQLSTDRVPFVLATVVRAQSPTSVQPGDTALVLRDGSIDGFVGEQGAESSVRRYSLRALKTGEPVLLRLIPDGTEADQSGGIEGAVVERDASLSGGSIEIFLEPQLPAARVVIVGGSPVARALEQLADTAGYLVEAVSAGDIEDFGDATAVVVASHGNGEEPALTGALSAGVPYVALVASDKRGEALREELELAPELKARLHTPAGVDIGAITPAEVAISILAELIVTQRSEEDEEQETSPEKTPETAAATDQKHAPASASPTNGIGPAQSESEQPVDPKPAASAPTAAKAVEKDPVKSLKAVDPLEALAADAASSVATATAELGVDFAVDPVCGMKVAVSPSTLHLDVGGERVYFCGTGCRVAYAHAPDGAKI